MESQETEKMLVGNTQLEILSSGFKRTGFIRTSPPVTIVIALNTQHFSRFFTFQVVSVENKEYD